MWQYVLVAVWVSTVASGLLFLGHGLSSYLNPINYMIYLFIFFLKLNLGAQRRNVKYGEGMYSACYVYTGNPRFTLVWYTLNSQIR